MKHILVSLLFAGSIGIVGLSVGCQSNSNLPSNERANTAGGSGEFGESPVRPGRYSTSDAPTPTTQPSPTATQ